MTLQMWLEFGDIVLEFMQTLWTHGNSRVLHRQDRRQIFKLVRANDWVHEPRAYLEPGMVDIRRFA
jgi:hypothetical protein